MEFRAPLSIDMSQQLNKEEALRNDSVLNEEEEEELSAVIQDMENRLFGLTQQDVKTIVYQYCSKKWIKLSFNEDKSYWSDVDAGFHAELPRALC